ncbi:MAG: hypothetical protein DCF25_01905 [Leptolyngbya foveolarum]|uniref:Uncharacterized protein n=1 Tax=Leptolyngbya foveolarum TaxID=47253 RepID=A0A2W4UQZ8_9CYAN|nr:MAG: hypothetical protein DCF25_01905 [Leptolyngbya foveolarum]
MARRKKESSTLAKAERRLSGMKSISDKLDLGNGLSTVAYEKEIVALRNEIAEYNTLLSKVDAASNRVSSVEKGLANMTSKMLTSVLLKYGKDSSEYEMAGGTRQSERRRRTVSQPSSAEAVPV